MCIIMVKALSTLNFLERLDGNYSMMFSKGWRFREDYRRLDYRSCAPDLMVAILEHCQPANFNVSLKSGP